MLSELTNLASGRLPSIYWYYWWFNIFVLCPTNKMIKIYTFWQYIFYIWICYVDKCWISFIWIPKIYIFCLSIIGLTTTYQFTVLQNRGKIVIPISLEYEIMYYMEASEEEWGNPVLNTMWVITLRLERLYSLYICIIICIVWKILMFTR